MLDNILYVKVLPLQTTYKPDIPDSPIEGEALAKASQINQELKETVNTRYGDLKIIPRITISIQQNETYSMLQIDVSEDRENNVFKQYVFDNRKLGWSLDDMSTEFENIKTEIETNESYISLVEFIKNNYENYVEWAQ